MEVKRTYTFRNQPVSISELKSRRWMRYLLITEENTVNVERVESIASIRKNYTLSYVEKTLDFARLENIGDDRYKELVLETLRWAEVSKCGTKADRKRWESIGLSLQIHNEASAEIYKMESKDEPWIKNIVYILIKTHGLLGQYLRGEVSAMESAPLLELAAAEDIDNDKLFKCLYELNRAIVCPISQQLWESIEAEIRTMLLCICEKGILFPEKTPLERMKRMLPEVFQDVDTFTKEEEELYGEIVPAHDFWYPQVALDTFKRQEIFEIFTIIKRAELSGVKHISFYDLSRTLFYDYENKRRTNIYKKRIIEFCLKERRESITDKKSDEHIQFSCKVQSHTLFFDVKFTKVCESLIQFCVEAERSGIIDYQKSITTIFDMFGFRRDVFDRLNNEEKYLRTMNETKGSRKTEILDFVKGNKIVDVGSGGGVLLDLLEKTYPQKTIIGTDISTNVIESLRKKIKDENHCYRIIYHNFVEEPLREKADTIIFSSILHEVFSYTEYEGFRFNINAVKEAVKNACHSLNRGGRIIIRDGIMSHKKTNGDCRLRMKDPSGEIFLQNYMKDFKGLLQLRNEDGSWKENKVKFDAGVLWGDINFIREFLYTYTWGTESYSCEVREQFGYFTLGEYKEFLCSLGLKLIKCESYLEEGYVKHLAPLVELEGFTWEDIPTNCILAAEY